jgi:hypothetical protein
MFAMCVLQYAHHGERARRRCLLLSNYAIKVCPDMQKVWQQLAGRW